MVEVGHLGLGPVGQIMYGTRPSSCGAIQLGPSWVNLIINLTKYINIIDFIYIIDIRKKNNLIDYVWIKNMLFQLYYEDFLTWDEISCISEINCIDQ